MMHSVVEAVFFHAAAQPDQLCVADEQESVTYAQYAERIRNLAGALRAAGVKAGDTFVVEARQTGLYLSIELALHLLGAVFVPLERNCAPEKIAEIAERSRAVGIVSVKNADSRRPYFSYEQIRSMAQQGPALEELVFPSGGEMSEVLFSTGTTGKEKGIMLTHANDIALAENVMYGVKMEPDNVEMIPSPLNHSHGLRRYYANMVRGASVVLVSSVLNVKGLFSLFEKYGVNSMDLVPTALSVLLKLSKGKLGEYQDQIRYIQLGAAPLMEADKEQLKSLLPKSCLYNIYGSTESGCATVYEFGQSAEKKSCIGKPAYNAEIDIMDDNRQAMPSSSKEATGLLASRGAMNMLGYWEDPEETARVLADGYVYSNDEGYYDEDGDIILISRRGDVINVGGNKVSPEEIENAARKMSGVFDCACVPTEDALKGHVPLLFVQMEAGCAFDALAIRGFLAELLEPYKVPRYIEAIDKIPRTYNGKLLRRKLPKKPGE